MRLPSELEQPPLSTDLDWMLSSSQTSAELIVEAVVHEHYASLFCLALAYLDDPHLAERAVQQALIGVVENRQRFRQATGVNQWLFQQLIISCRRLSSQVPNKSSRKSTLSDDPAFGSRVTGPSHPKEGELWQLVNESGEPARSVLLLYYLNGLSTREIAAILAIQEADVTSILVHSRDWLYPVRPEGIALGEDAESWVARSMQRRWSCQKLSEADQNDVIASVIRSLDERSHQKQIFNLVQQILSVLAVLTILAVIGWVTNRFFRVRPQKAYVYVTATSRPRPTGGAPVAIPTDLPERSLQRLPPLARWLEPLNAFSQPDEIRQRMYESHTLWSNVWVDAQLIRYGPGGFVGPGQAYRNLMWINNPGQDETSERRLVIAGSADQNPLYASLVQDQHAFEVDFRKGLEYSYALRETNPFYDLIGSGYRRMYGFDLRGVLDGSYLSSMLFGAGMASLPGELMVIGQGRMLGRDVLIVVNQLEDGHLEQMWLETHTGMVMRWQGYSDRDPRDALPGYSGSDPRRVLTEIILTGLEFGVKFPDDILSSSFIRKPPVTWDDLENAGGLLSLNDVVTPPPDQKQSTQYPPPSPGFDPSQSCLLFQWPEEIRNKRSMISQAEITTQAQDEPLSFLQSKQPLSNPVEIFADDLHLGQIQMSAPWYMQCERSAEGDLIACLDPPPDLAGVLYAESNLYWFSLFNLEEVHRVSPEAVWVGSDFAFSPDGHYLAYWACEQGSNSCGIYLQDTTTLKAKKLINLKQGATFLRWTSDSQYLAFVATGQTIQSATNYVVVRVNTGEVLYEGPFFWPDMHIPPDSPADYWRTKFPPHRNKLSSCSKDWSY